MRIKKIKFHNYRQLRDTEIVFDKNSQHDLHVVIGKNGTGKTNILNSVNWCLYNDEPNITIKYQQYPILNRNAIVNVKQDREYQETFVEISMEGDSTDYIFKRTAGFIIDKNEKPLNERVKPTNQKFEIEVINKDEAGSDIQTYEGSQADDFIESLIPISVRDFYFFDGERLDNYFREATSKNVKHSIFILSQIDLLERVDKRLIAISKDFTREAVDNNPYIKKFEDDINRYQKEIDEKNTEISECENEINTAKDEIEKCNERLKGLPDTKGYENRRVELIDIVTRKKARLKDKIVDKNNKIFEDGIKVMLFPAIDDTTKLIKVKRDKNEIPPDIKSELLEEIIKKGFCDVCGRELDKNSINKIKAIMEEKRVISDVGHKLEDIEDYLNMFLNNLKDFIPGLKQLTIDVKELQSDIENAEDEITKIDKKLSGYDIKDISTIVNIRDTNEKLMIRKIENYGVLKNRRKRAEVALVGANRLLEKELKKQKRTHKIRKKILFTKRLLEVLSDTKSKLIKETRKEIGKKTKEIFLDLIWKKGDFKDIYIDENYILTLIDLYNTPCLAKTSRAEKLLLSLSYTYALHEVSGLNSAFIIDTPVSPTDDENRENLGKTFVNISKEKQLILLFIPTEYSQEISKIMDSAASNKFYTNFNMETGETILEVS